MVARCEEAGRRGDVVKLNGGFGVEEKSQPGRFNQEMGRRTDNVERKRRFGGAEPSLGIPATRVCSFYAVPLAAPAGNG